jgi:membrane protease YdiL (CAAX protease family)
LIRQRNPLVVLIWSFGLYILIHTTQYVGYLVASSLSGVSFESIISGEFSNHLTLFGQGVTAAVLGIPFMFLVAKFLWRRPWSWVRLQFDIKLLTYGFFFGGGTAIVALLAVGLVGDIHVTATPDRFTGGERVSIILGALGWVAFIAILEEFIFRGIAVREWAARWGWSIATLLGGIYFAAAHIIGLLPNVGAVSVLWIVLAALVGTLMFVALYVRSKSLWLPIGFHAGWNLSLKTLFGTTMSGQDSSYGLFTVEMSGPGLVTGGVFGIEASVLVMAISIVIALLMLLHAKSGKPRLLDSEFDEATS